MFHLIDILSCIKEGVFQLKPSLSVIASRLQQSLWWLGT